MQNGTVPAIADLLRSSSTSPFRLHPVDGDSMEPTLRGGIDFAVIRPVEGFSVDGVYLIAHGSGFDLYRVQQAPGGLLLSKDNRRYQAFLVRREQFETAVCGLVIADVVVRLTSAQIDATTEARA